MEEVYNEHKEASKVVIDVVGKAYMEAEEKRWIAEQAGDHKEAELQKLIAVKFESIAHLVSPPDYYFIGYNKLDQCTGISYRIRLLQERLEVAKEECDFVAEDYLIKNINRLRSEAGV